MLKYCLSIFLVCSAASAATSDDPAPKNIAEGNFWKRFAKAYHDDWHPTPSNDPEPAYRGYAAPESNPPYPFTVWPIGGTVNIGQPFIISTPLMTALYAGPHGDAWKKSKITIYGWGDLGINFSTSGDKSGGRYANAPAAYSQVPNNIALNQAALYIERQPDTVQKEHFDWGFRLTQIYGTDYRFTTAKGIFSQQLLNVHQKDGTFGRSYGYDPVMLYADLYFPHVAEGMNVRIGRYVSLPDIEAQLAPNNYTFTHSLTYSYDCYTQTGANATIKLSDHWTVQAGLSAGCESAPWSDAAVLTGNACLSYTWSKGGDNVYVCANSLNSAKYNYNNISAYYATWYHKFNSKWHTATEFWYQFERQVPNVLNPNSAALLQTNANGAFCKSPTAINCFAPDYAILNYTSRQLGKKDFITIRNEFFNDLQGQRTGFKSRYVEDGFGWNHWIGTSIAFRPELRFERSLDVAAYQNGTKKSQFMFAADMIWFF